MSMIVFVFVWCVKNETPPKFKGETSLPIVSHSQIKIQLAPRQAARIMLTTGIARKGDKEKLEQVRDHPMWTLV